MLTFMRYPGSKAKLSKMFLDLFPDDARFELQSNRLRFYCEPFFGSGAVGLQVLNTLQARKLRTVLVNDLDRGIADLWLAVRDAPGELIRLVREFEPTPDNFYRFKDEDGKPGIDPILHGFRKLALHQTSFSGLGSKAGGPLGGRRQRSEYNTACRWNPERVVKCVRRCHALMAGYRRFEIACEDFATVLSRVPDHGFAYLDPPYYEKGEELYKHSMTADDHVRLAEVLHRAKFRWVLSYDDHPQVRGLYSWAVIDSFEMTATIDTVKGKRRKNREIVVRGGTW